MRGLGVLRDGAPASGLTQGPGTTIADNEVVRGDTAGVQGSDFDISDTPQLLAPNGTGAAPSISWINSTSTGDYRLGADDIIRRVSNVSAMRWRAADVLIYKHLRPDSTGVRDLGSTSARLQSVYTGGRAFSGVSSAAASYTADAGDHMIIMTAATAEIVLPSIATVGDGFELLVRFEGATSRTMTPDGTDTVDTANPVQNGWYRAIAFGVNWRMIRID